ncbi:MAG: MarP family serine protease [Actinobacteria bacterium]|nr:MarP family serine protease [Actinomycetota bacterium]
MSGPIQQSKIVGAIDRNFPPAPSVFSQLRHLMDSAGFPDVFAELEPAPSKPVALPDDPEIRAAVLAARASTVKIAGVGCGGIKYGSGFIVAPGVVVTNAHVVAGIRQPSVEDPKTDHKATVVFFDPNYDIAVLRTSRLSGKALTLLRSPVKRGQKGAALGFPGGGDFHVSPAAVLEDINAVGRDIYSKSLSQRRVYELQSEVHPGNSGGPLVRSDGTVVGVIFSASAFRSNVAYALRSVEVAQKVDAASASHSAVDTGPCS